MILALHPMYLTDVTTVVYQVKCIVDQVLDVTEELTDGILNDLEDILPMIKALDGQAAQTACAAGIEILGICVPL